MKLKKEFLWILLLTFDIMAPDSGRAASGELYEAGGKRDPFVPLVTSTMSKSPGLLGVETAEDVVVEGIVYDPKKGSVVILNGSLLKEGEEFGALKVIAVKQDGVSLSINGIESFKPIYQTQTEAGKQQKVN